MASKKVVGCGCHEHCCCGGKDEEEEEEEIIAGGEAGLTGDDVDCVFAA